MLGMARCSTLKAALERGAQVWHMHSTVPREDQVQCGDDDHRSWIMDHAVEQADYRTP